ncbi:MAG: HEAT repeat domain-containing protein [Legionellales bacterium]|nr:HEAT repeat domain-containing protein [Legionellales bacterium]
MTQTIAAAWMDISLYLPIIKWIALSQLVIVILLISSAFGIKTYVYYHEAYLKKIGLRLHDYLIDCVLHEKDFDLKIMMQYKRYIILFITVLSALDKILKTDEWVRIRHQIMDFIVHPRIRKFATSRVWRKRLFACVVYESSYVSSDEHVIKALINDKIPLVAIHAVMVALQNPTQALMDTTIDVFSNSRRVQQALYTQVISHARVEVIPLIEDRLMREHNPYVKSFCYRILTAMPYVLIPVQTADDDLISANIDLELSVMAFWFKHFPAIFLKRCHGFLHDPRWEIRARAVKLLGEFGDSSYAEDLGESLKDESWWVRINAATALGALGRAGSVVLRRQNPRVDQFAYDVATQVLSTLKEE